MSVTPAAQAGVPEPGGRARRPGWRGARRTRPLAGQCRREAVAETGQLERRGLGGRGWPEWVRHRLAFASRAAGPGRGGDPGQSALASRSARASPAARISGLAASPRRLPAPSDSTAAVFASCGSVAATGTPSVLGDLPRRVRALADQQQADPAGVAEQVGQHLDPGPGLADLAQRRPQHQHHQARGGQHRLRRLPLASRRPQSAMTSAGWAASVAASTGQAGASAVPWRGSDIPASSSLPRSSSSSISCGHSAAAAASGLCPDAMAQREQAFSGRQVPGEQPGQDVATAGVAFGQDHLSGPAERQRQRRRGHARRSAGRHQGVQAHGAVRWVMTRAIWPVAA